MLVRKRLEKCSSKSLNGSLDMSPNKLTKQYLKRSRKQTNTRSWVFHASTLGALFGVGGDVLSLGGFRLIIS